MTLVKFLLDDSGDIFAYFPQLNYNKRMYGNTMKTGYAHIGQHYSISIAYAVRCEMAVPSEYNDLLAELKSIGYDLKVLNKGHRVSTYDLPTYWGGALINGDYTGLLDEEIEQIDKWFKFHDPGNAVSMAEDSNFTTFKGMGCDVSEYTFIKH